MLRDLPEITAEFLLLHPNTTSKNCSGGSAKNCRIELYIVNDMCRKENVIERSKELQRLIGDEQNPEKVKAIAIKYLYCYIEIEETLREKSIELN